MRTVRLLLELFILVLLVLILVVLVGWHDAPCLMILLYAVLSENRVVRSKKAGVHDGQTG
jgi:hypothetical protein